MSEINVKKAVERMIIKLAIELGASSMMIDSLEVDYHAKGFIDFISYQARSQLLNTLEEEVDKYFEENISFMNVSKTNGTGSVKDDIKQIINKERE